MAHVIKKNREDLACVCFGLCAEDKPKNARFGLMCDGADLFFGNRKSVEKFQGLDHFAGFSLLDYAEHNDVSCRIQKIPRFDQMIPSHEGLRTQRGAADYLTRIYNECSSAEFAVALGAVCKARQCLSEIARKAGMPRPSLYRTLMEGGNTKLTTLQVILKELDLEVFIKPTSPKELKMNAVEIEAGVSELATERFHAKEFQTLCVNVGLELNKLGRLHVILNTKVIPNGFPEPLDYHQRL